MGSCNLVPAVSPMSGSPTSDTEKRKIERGEFITPPRPTGRRNNNFSKLTYECFNEYVVVFLRTTPSENWVELKMRQKPPLYTTQMTSQTVELANKKAYLIFHPIRLFYLYRQCLT